MKRQGGRFIILLS